MGKKKEADSDISEDNTYPETVMNAVHELGFSSI